MLGLPWNSLEVDLFNAGLDSLKAIQMRHTIQRTLDLNGNHLSTNVINEQGDLAALAKYLFSLGPGGHNLSRSEDKTLVMKELIQKYSSFGETVVRSIALAEQKLSLRSNYKDIAPDRGHRLPRCPRPGADDQKPHYKEGILPCVRREPNG